MVALTPDNDGSAIVFIIASPRSGTTLLADVLGRHSQIAEWYEPYFVWDWDTGFGEDDIRTAVMASATSRQRIHAEFARVRAHFGASVVVEKLPEHAFQIPYLNAVFPNARYIHLVRDGRDVVHSIHREWRTRQRIAGGEKLRDFLKLTWSMLRRQALWRHRAMAIAFELRQRSFTTTAVLNKAKWATGGGWGPRFANWRAAYQSQPLLSFNAQQWLACEQQITKDLILIDPKRQLSLRYEDFVDAPPQQLTRLLRFIGLDLELHMTQGIDAGRTHQWQSGFDQPQREQIARVIQAQLVANGYVDTDDWWRRP